MSRGHIDEERWLSIVDGFAGAALDSSRWNDVLLEFAQASGSRGGQLVGFGPDGSHFNWVGDTEPGWLEEFAKLGGTDPRINPRLRSGLGDPVLKAITDDDVVDREARRHSPFYAEILPQMGLPHICATVLLREPGLNVGLAVVRTASQGEISEEQRALFTSVAYHARAAVRTQLLLEGQGAALIAGALEAVSVAAFVCDRTTTVRAMTPLAEALVSKGRPLQLQKGQLRTGSSAQTKGLVLAIQRAASGLSVPASPAATTVIVRDAEGLPTVVDVMALPGAAYDLRFRPRILVIVRGGNRDQPPDQPLLLRSLFGLTQTEAVVALLLADGASLDDVAGRRQRSVETVRVQVRAIYAKLGVRRQGELVALLARFR